MTQLIQSGASYNMQVQVFTISDPSEVANLPTNIPMGSYAECITSTGLTIYMLRKTEKNPDNGEWIKI